MVDRNTRDTVLAAMDDYLSGRIRSFEFDERLHKVESRDTTVNQLIFTLWSCYDDIIDHPVRLTREGWDYLQRVRLVLHSNAEFTDNRRLHWRAVHTFSAGKQQVSQFSSLSMPTPLHER